MTLGYALLHPRQLEAALVVKREKRGFDLMVDMLCGVLGIQGVDAELEAAFTAQGEAMAEFAARFETLFEPGRPLAQFKLMGEFDISDPDAIAGVFTALCDFLETAEAAQVKALAIPVIDAVLEVLPNLDTEVVAGFTAGRLDEIVNILKTPLRQGRKDVAAIKAYRAAMQLRCLLDPAYQKLEALGRVDLKLELRAVLIALLDGLDGMDFGPLRTLVAELKGEFGGLMRASLACAGGGSVSAGVEAMPDEILTIFDEVRAAPHTLDKEPALWWMDLVTNTLNLFNLIWEINRSRPFRDRGADGAFLIIGALWHGTRTVLRATIPETISRPPEGDDSNAGQDFANWLFSDWGDTAIHLFLRFLVTLFYEAPDAAENWALMLAARWMQYFVNTFNFRIWYQFARSIWYFREYKNLQDILDDSEITEDIDLERMPLGRMMTGILGPIWLLMGVIGGAGLKWEDFEVENVVGPLIGIALGSIGAWTISHFWVSAAAGTGVFGSITKAALPDAALWFTTFFGMAIMVPGLWIVIDGIESEQKGTSLGFLIAIAAILAVCLVVMGIWWAAGSNTITQASGGLAGFSQAFSLLSVTVMGVLGAVTWWFIIDDGRDKRGDYEILDVEKTPYRLPLPAGQNWFCGQSFHGFFSHLFSSTSSHFAVDMNEAQGKPSTAARSGIVITATQGNPSNLSVQNDVILLHSEWVENADPGSENERVLTYSDYVHAEERGIHARTGQFVPQGMHLVDIDSTGRSAQHHIHYSGQTAQQGAGHEGLPFIFGDPSLRDFRNYPPLAIFPTRHPIPGKPLSFAFYISDNALADPHPHALTIATGAADVTVDGTIATHSHRFMIDRSMLTGGAVTDPLTLTSTVAAGHFHTVTLTPAQLLDIFRMDAPESVSTDETFDHTHRIEAPLIYEWISFNTEELEIQRDGEDRDNQHNFLLGLDFLTRNTIPAGGLTRTTNSDDSHNHDLTLSEAQVRLGFALGNPGVTTTAEQNVSTGRTVSPHTHNTIRCTGVSAGAGNMNTSIVEPPAGQLTARKPGPYDLLGERMVVRVNDCATEWHFWGGARARVVADIAMDHGLVPGDQIRIGAGGTTVAMPPVPATRASLRDSAAALSEALRTPAAATPLAAPPRRVVLRGEPVLVVETRQRGTGAQLERTGGTLPHALLPAATATDTVGTGPFADLGAVARADFLAHVTGIVQNGWPATPGPVVATMNGQQLSIAVSGGPANFTGSSSRIGQVATTYYDTVSRLFHGSGPLPVGPGRLALAPGFDLPLLATPAQIALPDPGPAAVLNIMVNGSVDPVDVAAGADLAETARRIMQAVEGVRARPEGGSLLLETISAGTAAQLIVGLGGTVVANSTGDAPAGLAFDDLTRLAGADLASIVGDASNRATLPPLAITHNLRVTPDGNRLRIEVDAPATVAATVRVTGGTDPVGAIAAQAGGQSAVSGDLPGTLAFTGPAWIDIDVTEGGTTETVRVPLDGEPARLDLLPAHLPENGETLTFDVNGTAVPVTFDGTERSVADMAERIGTASAAISVRLAYRMTVEEMLWGDQGGDLTLEDTAATADGLALAGFLGPRPLAPSDQMGRGEDMLAQGAIFPVPERRPGTLVDVAAFSRVGSPGGSRMRLTASGAATSIVGAVRPGADPLNFAAGATPDILQSVALAEETDLGATVLEYHFTARDARGLDIAHGFTQLCALPAIARTVGEASLPVAGPGLLEITVIEPDDTERPAAVDLSGVTTLDEAATRINAACPQIRAWVARISEAPNAESTLATGTDTRSFDERLHLETVSGGTGWRITLGDLQTAAALGFPLSADQGGTLLFSGRGNITNGAAADRDEIANALREAVDSMTGSINPPGAGTEDRISVQVDGNTLELRSAEGQLDLVFEPPGLADRFTTDIQADVTRINVDPGGGGAAPAALALDSGRILVRTGGRGLAAVEIAAAPAHIESQTPIPLTLADVVTEQLDLLKAHQINLVINGALRVLPLVPASVTTLEDAVNFLARATDPVAGWQGDDWWIGLVDVPGTPGAKQCVIETLRRGQDARLLLDLSAFPTPLPANGILGFTDAVTADQGPGNVLDIDAVPVTAATDSLFELVEEAVARGGARQSVYAASTDAAGIRLRGSLAATVLNQITNPATAPGGVDLTDAGGGGGAAAEITHAYTGTRPVEPREIEIQSDDTAGSNPRLVRAFFHAEPARLGPFGLPVDLAVLNGRTLALTVESQTLDIALAADAATTALDLLRQIEQQSGWTLRGTIAPGAGAITLETLRRGSAARLELRAAAASDAVTGDPATGLTGPAETDAAGTGAVGDIAAVTPADYAAVLQNGMIADRQQADDSVLNGGRIDGNGVFPRIAGSAYDPPERDVTDPDLPVHALPREYAQIASQRTGCASSLEPVTLRNLPALPAAFDMDRSLERAPAVRAALRFPPFGTQRLSGRLHIQFNENSSNPNLPPEQTFVVDIADADYDAESLARTIHGQLFGAGIGAAQAYVDGSVMIETLAAGIGGTVRIPAQSTPDAERPFAESLIPGGGFMRGWPGAGRTAPGTPRNAGFRSRVGDLLAAPNWVFTDGAAPTAPAAGPPATPEIRNDTTAVFTAATGDTLADTATALDQALANGATPGGATRRIGFALFDEDGALLIEGTTSTFDMLDPAGGTDGAGNFVRAETGQAPDRIGGAPERALEPAAHLRRTAEPRTLRILRDRNGHGVLEEHDDLGWVRVPASPETGAMVPIQQMPPGSYLTLSRADAAKTRDYDAGSEMIAHAAPGTSDATQAMVAQARYWLGWDGSAVMGAMPGPDGLVLVRLERGIR